MVSACGRYVMVFNGEIYNHLDMRKQLEQSALAPSARHSDTETLLPAFRRWASRPRCRRRSACSPSRCGIVPRASWCCARSEKPLYYGYSGADLVFASELGLTPVPGFGQELNRNALASYMRQLHSGAASIYAASPSAARHLDRVHRRRHLQPPHAGARVYWSARDAADTAARSLLAFESDAQAVDALEGVLSKAVGGQMLSDVSLGAFLSGGIDSSTIVALMQAQSAQPVRTFAIGFHERATTRRSTPRLSPPTWAPTIPSCTSPPRMRWRWCRRWRTCMTNRLPIPRRFRRR